MSGYREVFSDRLSQSLIGPGCDVYAAPIESEVIGDYPLQRYYSGILFPERQVASPDEENGASEFGNSDDDPDDDEYTGSQDKTVNSGKRKPEGDDDKEGFVPANQYFPTNCGLTFCVNPELDSIKVIITGGYYKNASHQDVAVPFTETEKDFLFSHLPEEFKLKLTWEDGKLFFNSKPEGKTKGGRSGDFGVTQQLRKKEELKDRIELEKLDRLLLPENRLWERVPFDKEIELNLNKSIDEYIVINEGDKKLKCLTKIITNKTTGKKYVKALLFNASEKQSQKHFNNSNKKLNLKSFFQVQLSVTHESIQSYKPSFVSNKFDPEADLINYHYRSIESFGIGHGCAVNWQKSNNSKTIHTTFFPEVDIPTVSNDFKDNPFISQLQESEQRSLESILDVKNLSIWSALKDKGEIIDKLKQFVNAYSKWIETQKASAKTEPGFETYAVTYINKQEKARDRLLHNIELLGKEENQKAFNCFLYANTAMYIQMVISGDDRMARKHKDIADFDPAEDIYDSLEFFQNYEEKTIAYRPFQLAFLLLNISSVIEDQAPDRKIVDLLWFPTGGGKTEAYLAVAAFTILWRRTHKLELSSGVSVIMRYTLRLLTAQQFERASRLICALDFLRAKTSKFGSEPITIGMWVGAATTPNTFADASEVAKKIDDAVHAINNGKAANPYEKNDFQVEACAWCGCKTISVVPATQKYIHGFDDRGKVSCLNNDCHFSDLKNNSIPVCVVDDALYASPPTLLFATVDKFAMLSHKAEGHRFFNSRPLDNCLPPDLIIQDELHLLNGPLGSIVGLFERIVEELCSRGSSKPKIIASTATTRNTDAQIQSLYNREVAVFPPSGIRHDDSFFAFTTKNSLRKYIGFMPTGKTGMDTQLEIMSHLLFARTELLLELRKSQQGDQELVNRYLDNYWTLVSYYNSLKDVGKTYNKINTEVYDKVRLLHQRHYLNNSLYDFTYRGLIGRTRELTSRIPSNKVKPILNELDAHLTISKNQVNNTYQVDHSVDVVLASNMISVGLDVGRLNLMLVNGQPRNVAEYIQASSRVARRDAGIVFNLLDANRAREKSYFENYLNFHTSFYKYVEPISLTPFTEITLDRMLNSILICYVRHKKGKEAHYFDGDVEALEEIISHCIDDEDIKSYMKSKMADLARDWKEKIKTANQLKATLNYKGKANFLISDDEPWDIMYSMREIDTSGVISVN
ncbi:hypothetical protein K3G39_20225 [Pontibacter sp. HSC-14F20]|uniref:helicase-related protein n=1 Tax=Pontibacter sp. HSC-14F20 TaxID=2864136 RepID=UPI001C733DE5|nr:helicase-related protein [Pontibacter sp. HSC-14F20]MBX0335565.1 hypothetical protein [Pontibacter sp. HSC-14F20]